MADCINEIEIGKTFFHIKDNVFTKLFEFLETLNRTILLFYIKSRREWTDSSFFRKLHLAKPPDLVKFFQPGGMFFSDSRKSS